MRAKENQSRAWRNRRLARGGHTDRSPGTPGRAKRPHTWHSGHDDLLLGAECLWAPPPQLQEGDRGTPSSQTTRDHGGEGLRGGPRASRLRETVRVRQEARPTPPPNSSSAPEPSLLGWGPALVGGGSWSQDHEDTPGPHGRAGHAGSALCAAVRGV